MLSQSFHVPHEVSRGVGLEGLIGMASSTAALVKQHHPCSGRVEELAVLGAAATAGPTVQKDHRHPLWVTAYLVIDRMAFLQR